MLLYPMQTGVNDARRQDGACQFGRRCLRRPRATFRTSARPKPILGGLNSAIRYDVNSAANKELLLNSPKHHPPPGSGENLAKQVSNKEMTPKRREKRRH